MDNSIERLDESDDQLLERLQAENSAHNQRTTRRSTRARRSPKIRQELMFADMLEQAERDIARARITQGVTGPAAPFRSGLS